MLTKSNRTAEHERLAAAAHKLDAEAKAAWKAFETRRGSLEAFRFVERKAKAAKEDLDRYVARKAG
jgi:hypothetical protein